MQQKVKEKARGRINLEDVGTVHLYNKKFKCFPIGLLDPITKICNEFGEHYNKEVKIFLDDKRDPKILNRTLGIMPRILYTKNELRDYQLEAINQFMAKEAGIINIATGGGKTLVATEIIRKLDAKTLWIIDRKELLVQTRDTLKELLGIPIGTISGGKVDIQDVTIATIQSLSSKIVDLQDYLYNVNFVVVDEYHKSAAATYQKVFAKLPNTKYRLGLTATAMRDDGKTPILFSLLGEIIYKCTSSDLIDMGYLVKPTIEFYDLNGFGMFDEKYSDDYRMNVVESNDRNNKIKDIVELNPNKKIMILTKQVEHGKRLKESIPEATYLHGTLGNETRTRIMESFRLGIFNTLIMTQSIGAEGLDIPDLDIIINAAANKGDVKSIQVLGRVLRIFNNKSEARYIDFVDIGKHTRKHSEARMLAFKEQGHTVVKR